MAGRGNEIGRAYFSLVPSMDGTTAAVNSQLGVVTAAGTRAGQAGGAALGAGLIGGLKTAGVIGAALGVAGAASSTADYFRDAVSLASDLEESANAVRVTYGEQADEIAKLGETAASRLGLSNRAFNDLAVRFSNFAGTIAGDGGDVIGIIDDLTTRGADFASVYNLEVEDALTLFQSGLAGETEPLRRFGIDLSAASVEAFALANGIGEQGRALTEAEKVQARYALLLESTNNTAGDFVNTQDSLANKTRITNAEFENAQAALGEGLLPAQEVFADFLLEEGVPVVERFSEVVGDNEDALRGLASFIADDLTLRLDTFDFLLGGIVALTDDWRFSTEEMEDILGSLPDWAQDAFVETTNFLYGTAAGVSNAVAGAVNEVIGFLNGAMSASVTASNFIAGLFGFAPVEAAQIPLLGRFSYTPLRSIEDAWGGGGRVPRAEFAEGGRVSATPGGIMGRIGEGRYDEVVLPLSDSVFRELAEGITSVSGGDRPIVMNGSIVGLLREVAGREAELVLAGAAFGVAGERLAGGVV